MDERKEALFYERMDQDKVKCTLCPHSCSIAEGKSGICGVRQNEAGTLYTGNYGKVAAIAMDPIEKKPLYHFHPGKYLLSIGTLGCNFKCSFCQNYHISQVEEADGDVRSNVSKEFLLSLCRQEEDCVGIAYTYNEPSVWYEYVLDTAEYIKKKGYKNVLVTNGYMSQEPLEKLLPYVDAMNIDVKGFTEEFYRKICGGSLETVKQTVERAAGKTRVEATTLIIPEMNDSREEMAELAGWLASVDKHIPLHLSRYYPRYKMAKEATDVKKMLELRHVCREFLDYVYLGNVYGENINTYCPKCGALLIKRDGGIFYEHLDDGICSKCGEWIDILI